MDYKCHEFCNGQVLEAGPLNEMDQAIADIAKKATITGKGAPTTATEGTAGRLYMDTDTGDLYKCIAAEDGVYTWVPQTGDGGGGGSAEGVVRYDIAQNLSDYQQARAARNIGAFRNGDGTIDLRGVIAEGILATAGEYDELIVGYVALYADGAEGVQITGIYESDNPTSAVNKRQLDNAERSIIDRLCPPIEASGAVVTCKPLEGYPLTVTAPDATTITRCGKNIFGGIAFRDAIVGCDTGGGVTVNDTDKTVTVYPNKVSRTTPLFNKFKENTQYTLIFWGTNTTLAGAANITFRYTDGTVIDMTFKNGQGEHAPVGEFWYCFVISDANKTIEDFRLRYVGGATIFQYEKCGIFEGVISVEDFEPYQGDTFAAGEQIPALPGVNNLWADTGDITVTGRADPVAIIENLQTRLSTLESAVVNNA